MIRFGSRTELVVATDDLASLTVAVGDTVLGGETLLARLHASVPEKTTA
jgi:hypothetical protein